MVVDGANGKNIQLPQLVGLTQAPILKNERHQDATAEKIHAGHLTHIVERGGRENAIGARATYALHLVAQWGGLGRQQACSRRDGTQRHPMFQAAHADLQAGMRRTNILKELQDGEKQSNPCHREHGMP
jgi:hypothetical protein